MKRNKRYFLLFAVMIILNIMMLTGCNNQNKMKDGYYTAEIAEFDEHGWKEYVCILVKNDKIISAEFNAKNESGYIKAWDNNYMKVMGGIAGTYPNEYTRKYAQQLIDLQGGEGIDIVTGASTSGGNFTKLVTAVITRAKEGNSEVVKVE